MTTLQQLEENTKKLNKILADLKGLSNDSFPLTAVMFAEWMVKKGWRPYIQKDALWTDTINVCSSSELYKQFVKDQQE